MGDTNGAKIWWRLIIGHLLAVEDVSLNFYSPQFGESTSTPSGGGRPARGSRHRSVNSQTQPPPAIFLTARRLKGLPSHEPVHFRERPRPPRRCGPQAPQSGGRAVRGWCFRAAREGRSTQAKRDSSQQTPGQSPAVGERDSTMMRSDSLVPTVVEAHALVTSLHFLMIRGGMGVKVGLPSLSVVVLP